MVQDGAKAPLPNMENKMQTKIDILKQLKSSKTFLSNKYNISKLGLFGSFARDEASLDSDIDILFEVEDGKKLSLFDYLNLARDLEQTLLVKVDLVREATLKTALKPYVYKDIVYV